MLFKCLLNYFNVTFYYYKYPLLPKVINDLVFGFGTKTEEFMLTYDDVKKDKYNLEDEKDLSEENYEKP